MKDSLGFTVTLHSAQADAVEARKLGLSVTEYRARAGPRTKRYRLRDLEIVRHPSGEGYLRLSVRDKTVAILLTAAEMARLKEML